MEIQSWVNDWLFLSKNRKSKGHRWSDAQVNDVVCMIKDRLAAVEKERDKYILAVQEIEEITNGQVLYRQVNLKAKAALRGE